MLRTCVALALSVATGIFAFAAGMGLSGSHLASVLAAIVAAALVALWIASGRGLALDPTGIPRWIQVVCGIATAAALVMVGRLAVFMIDPSKVACSFAPSSQWELQHNCLTAYHVAAEASSGPTSIYDNSLYSLPDDDPSRPRKARMLGTFTIDVFEYPPPFLLLPRALQLLTPEFLDLRMVWFGLSGGLLLLGLATVAAFLGPGPGTRALLLSPFVFLATTTLSTLQKGNVQVIVVVMAMLAMVLFERRRPVTGGALLAFATASKIYPGLLVVSLLARRRWRAVGWTTVWGVGFVLLTLAAFGWAPYTAFLDHLPRLLSGESFPAFRNPRAMAINLSVPGLLFKAKLFGIEGATFELSRLVGSAYILIAVAVTVYVALRAPRALDQPLVWAAIVILATLRSPFLPQAYGTLPSLWLLTLLAARAAPRPGALAAAAAAWLVLAFNWPMDWPIDLRLLAVTSLMQMAVTGVLVVLVFRSATRSPEA
jgi:alpha-1,2-mannosyltransferase